MVLLFWKKIRAFVDQRRCVEVGFNNRVVQDLKYENGDTICCHFLFVFKEANKMTYKRASDYLHTFIDDTEQNGILRITEFGKMHHLIGRYNDQHRC